MFGLFALRHEGRVLASFKQSRCPTGLVRPRPGGRVPSASVRAAQGLAGRVGVAGGFAGVVGVFAFGGLVAAAGGGESVCSFSALSSAVNESASALAS